MRGRFSKPYIELLKRGAFPGQIDPWAEIGRYFQQIHAEIIGYLLLHLQDPLLELGYTAGRENSLTITERSEPDFYVERRLETPRGSGFRRDYAAAAAEISAEPGIDIDWQAEAQEALFITAVETQRLVTVVEVVSPCNKTKPRLIEAYQERRSRLLTEGVNIVEIDLTRSYSRLLENRFVATYLYHVAIYLPGRVPRLVGMDYGESLKRIALPLDEEVLPIELQAAYDHAYQVSGVVNRIYEEKRYIEESLPFPTTLTPAQRQDALEKVAVWRAELERLRNEPA